MDKEKLRNLLMACGCNDLEELYNYIDYLENIKQDYDFLKSQINGLCDKIRELY